MKTDNELIAEFMGVTVWKNWSEYLDATYYKMHHPKPTNDSPLTVEQRSENKEIESKNVYAPTRYDSSWDWLMPVVEKINGMGKMVNINFYTDPMCIETVIYNWGLGDPQQRSGVECNSPIESVYTAVVEFIKWYNQNKSVQQ